MTAPARVRVLLVDDSRTHRAALRAVLEKSPELEVVGVAADGEEAVAAVLSLLPQVVLMDVRMPRLDGLEATRRIMAERPTPILLMTADDNLSKDVDLALRATEYGALDLVAKPDFMLLQDPAEARKLVSKLRLLAGVPVISHLRGRLMRASRPQVEEPAHAKTTFHRRANRLVCVVASTGGPSALKALLSQLPATLKAAVVIVQHIDRTFEEGLVRWLDEESPLSVVLANDNQDLHTGTVYVAPQRRYVEVTDRRRLSLVDAPYAAGAHCPSGDRLFETAASAYGAAAIGVVLTGMGQDGAKGALELRRQGALTIAQDEATSVIWGMPGATAQSGAAQLVLPLDKIAGAIQDALR